MSILPSDLIIRFDPDTQSLCFLQLKPSKQSTGGVGNSALVLKHEISHMLLAQSSPEEVERLLGFDILAFLSIQHRANLTQRDYQQFADSSFAEMLSSLRADASGTDNPEAKFLLARSLISDFSNRGSIELIHEIDVLLKTSAQAGCEEARQYVEGMWPQMRSILEKRLARSS